MRALLLFAVICSIACSHRHGKELTSGCRSASLRPHHLTGLLEVETPSEWSLAAFTANATMLSSSWTQGDEGGQFSLLFSLPSPSDGLVFVVARRGRHVLLSVLHKSRPSSMVINALTTVAASYGMGALIQARGGEETLSVVGDHIQARNAGMVAFVLADSRTGSMSHVLQENPNADLTTTRYKLRQLRDAVADCASDASFESSPLCRSLLAATGRPNAALALARLASSPGITVEQLPHSPADDDWTLPVIFTQTGDNPANAFNGPGGLAFTAEGNIIPCENYQYFPPDTDCDTVDCNAPGGYLAFLGPDGEPLSNSPFFGGTEPGVAVNGKKESVCLVSFSSSNVLCFRYWLGHEH